MRECTYGEDFELAVARSKWTKSVTGHAASGNGVWAVAYLGVTCAGTKAEGLATRPLQPRDAAGRQYDAREKLPDSVELASADRVKSVSEAFQPGVTERTVLTIEMPKRVGLLSLVGKRELC